MTERKDVLSGLFFVLTLGAYVEYARHQFSLLRYLAVMVFFALGLMAKAMLVTLPLALLLLDCWPLGRMTTTGGNAVHFPGLAKLAVFLVASAWRSKISPDGARRRFLRVNGLGPKRSLNAARIFFLGMANGQRPDFLRCLPRPVSLPG